MSLKKSTRARLSTGTRWRVLPWFLGLMVPVAGCTDSKPLPRADTPIVTASAAPARPDSAAKVVSSSWQVGDGSAIYLPGDGGVAQVVLPPVLDDSVPPAGSAQLPAGAAPATVDLFAPIGRIGSAALGEYVASAQPEVGEGCDAWPVVPFRNPSNAPASAWKLAIQAGLAEPFPTDSIGGLSPSDSAALVIQVNRAAALLPQDGVVDVLGRVPFSVRSAYRLRFPGDVDAVVAVVERRLNMEASPRVERSVLVLERPPKVRQYLAVWRDRQYAIEDDLVAVELLAVVRFRESPQPVVFLGLDFGDGSRVQMLRRTSGGIWSLRWASAYTGC